MSVTISQIGIPATIVITPGPGVSFAGTGAAGVGIVSTGVDANGHLQVLLSNGTTIDAGAVGHVVTRITATGTNQATAAPLTGDVNLVVAYVPGGAVMLPTGINLTRVIVNKLPADLPVYPPVVAGAAIDQLAAGAAATVPAGTTAIVHSPDGIAWTSE